MGRNREASGRDLQRKVFRGEFRRDNAFHGRSETKGKDYLCITFLLLVFKADSIQDVQLTAGVLSNLTLTSNSREERQAGHPTREAATQQMNSSGFITSCGRLADMDSDDNFFTLYPFIGGTTSTAMRRRLGNAARLRDSQDQHRHAVPRNTAMAGGRSGMNICFPRIYRVDC